MPRTKKPVKRINTGKLKSTEKNNKDELIQDIILKEVNTKKKEFLQLFERTSDSIELMIRNIKLRLGSEKLKLKYEEAFAGFFPLKQSSGVHEVVKYFESIISKENSLEKKTDPALKYKRKSYFHNSNAKKTPYQEQNKLFLTPQAKIQGSINPVTPKLNPNTALTMLRHPRKGEIGISINGSPLLVSTIQHHDLANVNIPLDDGNVVTLIGHEGEVDLNRESIDRRTRDQLRIIRNKIGVLVDIPEENEDEDIW